MIYAATFPRFKLRDPAQFIRALIRDGEAGDASPIGTDYPMLETGGIVRVVAGSQSDRFKFELLQADVAEKALTILTSRAREPGAPGLGAANLHAQRSYTHIETERARIAIEAPPDDEDTRVLVASLRQSITTRGIRGG
jgi:hypothetical protein